MRRLYEEKTKLVSTCEELSNERDSKTQLLQRHEKVKYFCQKYITISCLQNIEMLSHAKMFLEKKIEELEQLALQETEENQRVTANEMLVK